MNCKELVYLLEDYFSGTMDERLRKELDRHMEMCEPCKNFLRTYDKTRILCRQIRPEEIPPELRERLRSFVMEKARHYLKRVADERRDQVFALIRAYREQRLSPRLAGMFQSHREGCPKCGAFIRGLQDTKETPRAPADIEEHIAEFLDALPPGEKPTRVEA